jgi:F-type H+-transporting ATPase subunit delta
LDGTSAGHTLTLVIVSGGFAVVQPNSQLSVNAVEAYTLDEFSIEAARAQLAESQKIAAGQGSEQDIAEAKIEVEVWDSHGGSEECFLADGVIGSRVPRCCPEINRSL